MYVCAYICRFVHIQYVCVYVCLCGASMTVFAVTDDNMISYGMAIALSCVYVFMPMCICVYVDVRMLACMHL